MSTEKRELYVKLLPSNPDKRSRVRYDLVRPPAGRSLIGTILSVRLLGLDLHYWGGRTVPHTEPACRACDAKNRRDWHNFFFLWDRTTGIIRIVQITDGPVAQFDEFQANHGSLRGASCKLFRHGKKDNSPQGAVLVPGTVSADELPPCPDLATQLDRIWWGNLTTNLIGEAPALSEEINLSYVESAVVGQVIQDSPKDPGRERRVLPVASVLDKLREQLRDLVDSQRPGPVKPSLNGK